MKPGKKAYNEIVNKFGDEILDDRLELDRKRLGEIIFNDEKKRKLLNSITHPIIRIEVFKKVFLSYLFGHKIIFVDIPLLYESKSLLRFVQKVIVVSCERGQQIERIMKRNQFNLEETESRINSQIDLKLKCELADYIIDNSTNLDNLKFNLNQTLNKIKKLNLHFKNLVLFRFILLSFTFTLSFTFWKLFNFIKFY